jgi:hypothetical protein
MPDNCTEVTVIQQPGGEFLKYQDLGSISNLANNTEVWICSREPVFLDSVIDIEDASNITIMGFGATLHCPNNTEAGFRFTNIHRLSISDVSMENCAANSTFDPIPYRNIRAAISIQYSSGVYISNVHVSDSPGTGLGLFDIDDRMDLVDSSFVGNGYDRNSGGNGLYLEVGVDSSLLSSPLIYNIARCRFINNVAETGKDSKISGFTRFDKGGGMCLFVRSHDGVKITVENSTVSGNRASTYGGGVSASFSNDASNSEITIAGSNYTQNRALYGGGQYSGYLHRRSRNQTPLNCSHVFVRSEFTNNYAEYGGGVSVFSTKTRMSNPQGNVSFSSCIWRENRGQFGSAVAILPNAWNINTAGFLPTIYFSDCEMDSNMVLDDLDSEGILLQQHTKGSGALFCTDHTLEFNQRNTFSRNNGSAWYLGVCIANFNQHSKTIFNSNNGYHGGAIYLIASALQFKENNMMIFDNNTAYDRGGAVFTTSYNFHMYDYSRTCFFSYRRYIDDPSDRNITIQFINNCAGTGSGHSIFAYSLLPCYRIFRFFISNITSSIFDSIGNVTYDPPNREMEIATAASQANTTVEDSGVVSVLPGEEITLPYYDTDDLGQSAKSVYLVTVRTERESSIAVDRAYTYISSDEVLLYGNTNDSATLVFSSSQSRQRSLSFNVTMLPCPPGYKLSLDKELNSSRCVCSYRTSSQYTGIEHCDITTWKAYRRRGYWVGYENDETEDENSLVTGYCPVGFCSHSEDLLLPATADREELNDAICGSRAGVLCGQCPNNNSVYYHSLHFTCQPDKHCYLGWLFYILSELVPVTILFLVIIFFNITFTSGKINGFIFFAQVVVMFHVTADDFIPLPLGVKVLNRILHFFYLIFNLNMFTLDEFSFCLFKGATALDVIAFSYITLIYSFVLVVGVIFLLNKLSMKCSCKAFRRFTRKHRGTLQGSIIHGLTAFLVLCYAKCTQASILLISYAGIRGTGSKTLRTVVFYNGDITWFSIQHLPYAIPAIFMTIVLVLLPPIVLLIYPLHFKILSALRISESKCVVLLLRPLNKLKPLLDSFQGSFKDEYRFFSGLYFVYRFSILAGVTLSRFQEIYFIIFGLLLFTILLHAIFQPYKERLHNIIDTLLFIDLAFINGITMYNFSTVESNIQASGITAVLGYIQSLLIGMPLVVLVVYLLRWVFRHFRPVNKKLLERDEITEEEELPARMLYNMEELDSSGMYHMMTEK